MIATLAEAPRATITLDAATEALLSPGMLMVHDLADALLPPHLRELDDAIVRVCRGAGVPGGPGGGVQRFLLNVEPIRHGKSMLATVYTAAWYLLTFPERQVLVLCYSQELAEEFGEQVRDVITRWGGAYSTPIGVSHTSKAKTRFRLVVNGRQVGGLRAVGMNGTLTGRGFHLVLADDLIKSRDEADSRAARNKAWRRYTSTIRTRLDVKVGTVIVTNSRWHTDDVVGRILEAQANPDADQYEVLHRTALARRPAKIADRCPYTIDAGGCARARWIRRFRPGWSCDGRWHTEDGRHDGEALWPERYSTRDLQRLWANIGDREFGAQLQGDPVMRGDGTVQTDRARFIDRLPTKGLAWCWAWDRALSSKGDYTAGALLAMDAKGNTVVAMVARIRTSDPDKRDRFIVETTRANGPKRCGVIVETEGSEGPASARFLRRRLIGRPLYLKRPPTDRSKIGRGEPFFAAMNSGTVFVLRRNSVTPAWWAILRDELDTVPVGQHDDTWDACAAAYAHLARRLGGGVGSAA